MTTRSEKPETMDLFPNQEPETRNHEPIEYLGRTEWGWIYETLHTDGKSKGQIHYAVWSDVFVCPSCTQDIVFFDSAYSTDAGKVQDEFHCRHCGTNLVKAGLEHATETYFDPILKEKP